MTILPALMNMVFLCQTLPGWAIAGIVASALLVFPLWFAFVVWLIGLGWRKLAVDFRAAHSPALDAVVFHRQTVVLGMARYKNLLTVSVSPALLHLKVPGFFSVGHPPLSIPWSSLSGLQPASRAFRSDLWQAMLHLPDGTTKILLMPKAVWEVSPLV